MLIALDYDGTYTEDPDLWLLFIGSARARGHKVWVVTMRGEHEAADVERQLSGKVDRIVYTNRRAKMPYLQSKGINPNIWIDDMPHFIVGDAAGAQSSGQLVWTP